MHELPHPVQGRLLFEAVSTVDELQGFSVRFYQNENLPLESLFLSVADFPSVWKQAQLAAGTRFDDAANDPRQNPQSLAVKSTHTIR